MRLTHGSCQAGRIKVLLYCCWNLILMFPSGASNGEFTLWNGLTFNFETILQAHDSPVRGQCRTVLIPPNSSKCGQTGFDP